ncbi:MAG: isocitrate lyase/phosphoenolpyruvate mutase family protein [Candidatus Acidiferrales bacterium]
MKTQSEKAEQFRRMHHGPEILVLPNAWDCASARIFEQAGFPAIATTSAGIAFSFGYPDGEKIPRNLMLATVRRIVDCVRIPVTADLEGGYDNIEKTASALIESGAIGLNLEDLLHSEPPVLEDITKQAEKIRMVRRIGEASGIHLVINARTDAYLAQIGEPASRFDHACRRLRAYIDAGADCVFLPGLTDEATIGRVLETLKFPLNILAVPGAPTISRLQVLGVARVSVGSGLMRSAMGFTRRVALRLKQDSDLTAMFDGAVPFAEANRLLEK